MSEKKAQEYQKSRIVTLWYSYDSYSWVCDLCLHITPLIILSEVPCGPTWGPSHRYDYWIIAQLMSQAGRFHQYSNDLYFVTPYCYRAMTIIGELHL